MPVQIPIGKEDKFSGIIDLITMKAILYKDVMGPQCAIEDIPDDLKAMANQTAEAH